MCNNNNNYKNLLRHYLYHLAYVFKTPNLNKEQEDEVIEIIKEIYKLGKEAANESR